MNKKKAKIIILVILIIAAICAGAIFGYQKYQDKKTVVEVFPVSYLDWGMSGLQSTSYGTVTDDQSQIIKPGENDKVVEVYVKEGDEVCIGTPLLRYDMETVNLEMEMKELQVSTAENDLTIAKRELERLKTTTPIQEQTQPTAESLAESSESSESEGSTESQIAGETSQEESQRMSTVSEGYTAEELAKKITEKEREVRDLDVAKRKAELELEQAKQTSGDGIVTATVNGVVASVQDLNNLLNDGSAFMEIKGQDSLYVTGAMSEFSLGQIQVGAKVLVTSMESGQTYDAVITEISTTPTDSSSYMGEGNPNASYYPYRATVENSEGLRNGENVELSLAEDETAGNALYIEKAYVRSEGNKFYVMIADEKKRLKKEYVTIGKTLYGQAVEITSGLDGSEYITFPYGKNVKEGVKVKETDEMNY